MKTALAGRGAGLSDETARGFVSGEPGIPGLWEAWVAQDACRAVMRERGELGDILMGNILNSSSRSAAHKRGRPRFGRRTYSG